MNTYKTIIIGSGIIGSSIAYHLSKKDTGILVIDKAFPSSGTTGANQSWVWVHTKKPDFYAEFSMQSAQLYTGLTQELSMDFEFVRSGGLNPIFTQDEWQQAEKRIKSHQAKGIHIELLNTREVLNKEPEINPSVMGATYSSLDAHINPFKLNTSFIREAENNGAAFSFYNEVTKAEKLKNGQFKVNTLKGNFYAEKVVIAGGRWSTQMGQWFNIKIPTELSRGQIMVTEPIPPLIRHIIKGIRQTQHGELLIGNSNESECNRSTSFDVMQQSASLAMKLIPRLKEVRMIRHFAGIRVEPIDKLPIMGEVPGIRGLFAAVTHSGITLSPIVGRIMSEIIVGEQPFIPIEPYDIKRFFVKEKIKETM